MRRLVIAILLTLYCLPLPIARGQGEDTRTRLTAANEDLETAKAAATAMASGDLKGAAEKFGIVIAEGQKEAFGTAVGERVTALEDLARMLWISATLPATADLETRERVAAEAAEALSSAPDLPLPIPLEEAGLDAIRRETDLLGTAVNAKSEEFQKRKNLEQELTAAAPGLAGEEHTERAKLTKLGEAGDSPLTVFLRATAELRLEYLDAKATLIGTAPDLLRRELVALRVEKEKAEVEYERQQKLLKAATQAVARDRKLQAEKQEAAAKELEEKLETVTDPIERFRLERRAEVHQTKADQLWAAIERDRVRQQHSEQREVDARIAIARKRLESWFRTRKETGAQDAKILQSTLDRVAENRIKLERRLIPGIQDEQGNFGAKQSDAQARLWAIETPLDERPEDLLRFLATVPEDRRAEAEAAYEEACEALAAPLGSLVGTLDEVMGEVGSIAARLAARSLTLDEIEDFAVTRMIWVRNEKAFGLERLSEVLAEMRSLALTYTDTDLAVEAVEDLEAGSVRYLALGAGAIFLLVLGLILTRRLRRFQENRKYRGRPIVVTLQRFLVLVGISAVGPLFLAAAAQMILLLDVPVEFREPIPRFLTVVATILFVRRFLLRLFAEEGLAVASLGAPPEVAAQLHRAARWLVYGLFFTILPHYVLARAPYFFTAIPGLLRIAIYVLGSGIVLSLLWRKGPFAQSLTGRDGFGYGVLRLVWLLLALGAVVVVAMSCLGYTYGARLIAANVVRTLGIGLALILVYHFLARVLRAAVKRLHLEWRDDVDQEDVIRQASRIFGFAVIVLAIVFVTGFWGLGRTIQAMVEEVRLVEVDASSGVYLTLWDVFVAILWIVAGHFLMRNIGGLYEAFLYPRLKRRDAGNRFVVLTISRYVIALVAYSGAILALHFDFSSLGWLLAAASVGLGFGMQEILSNFVSGLILFFERPVRVGDWVSVGEAYGTVEKITIRATHVKTRDQQMIILPNRRFIVDEVVNWSHDNPTVRSRLSVGVAYGTNVEKVTEILMEIAGSNMDVRKSPLPQVRFTTFGASSLDFELLIHTDVYRRNQAISKINGEIHQRFMDEGIEIPFPQRVYHQAPPRKPAGSIEPPASEEE